MLSQLQYQALAEPVPFDGIATVPDLVLAICEMPVLPPEQRDPGEFSFSFQPIIPVVSVPDFVQIMGQSPFFETPTFEYMLAGGTLPPIDSTFPTTLDDLLDILRGLAAELQPNAQNEWEKRRNWQKVVEALGRI